MTANDIKVIKGAGERRNYRCPMRNDTGLSYTLKPGEVAMDSEDSATLIADGGPAIGADAFIGVIAKESTETATADGDVEITTLNPGKTVLRGDATTATNVDTLSEIRALLNNNICFDLTASTGTNGIFTIDENETDDPNVHGLRIIDGDKDRYTLDVIPNILCTEHAPYL